MWTLSRGLKGYVQAVAAALGVPAEATSSEISDTATAYLGLSERAVERPEQDLMLVWTERDGWSVVVETNPAEAPVVLAELGDGGRVPEPPEVARFVSDVVAGRRPDRPRRASAAPATREELARQLARYAGSSSGLQGQL